MSDLGRFRVLLIGIDAYPGKSWKPLSGCVNDIDGIQRLLINQAGIPPEHIQRLASPLPDTDHETAVPEAPATLSNIRSALGDLGSESVSSGDRVFIYYAGHGASAEIKVGDHVFFRESLVAADAELLLDLEFNQLIARIAARTHSVTVVLDSCQSAGATRSASNYGGTPRFIDLQAMGRGAISIPAQQPGSLAMRTRGVTSGLAELVDQCQVVAGCLNHELANEETEPGSDGVKHGRLTRSLMNALDGMSETEIRTVPWGRVWHKMREEVVTAQPDQHLWMSGNLARAVLAGPPTDGDVGLGISRSGDVEYKIDAGTLSGITVGARLAVYAETPFRFPPLNSSEDHNARISDVMLVATSASRGSATAQPEGEPFDLPPGARARLVRAGADPVLCCAIVPEEDELIAALAASPLLKITSQREAEVCLERRKDGRWALTDDLHGSGDGEPVLFSLTEGQFQIAPAVLEHYLAYSLPFRMAKQCTDLPGAMQVRLLQCPSNFSSIPTEVDVGKLPEVTSLSDTTYQLKPGTKFCIRVHNASDEILRVAVVNSAGSGRVEMVGIQSIDPRATDVFWQGNTIGEPFVAVAEGAGRDRLVTIGTTLLEKDLNYLATNISFAESTRFKRGILSGNAPSGPPVEQWTATETIVRIG